MNNLIKDALPFDVKTTVNFPSFWYYKPTMIYSLEKYVNIGIAWSYQSSGSRISRQDYSGEYYFDNKIHKTSPSIIVGLELPISKLQLVLSNELGIEYSKLEVKEFISVGEFQHSDIYKYKSVNYFYLPNIESTPKTHFIINYLIHRLLNFQL
jgi:hypothetical protein